MRLAAILIVVALVSASCGCRTTGRDISSPRKALLGHWRQTVPGYGEIYISPEKIIYFSREAKQPIRIPVPYSISEENGKAFSIKIKLESSQEPATVTFSTDRSTMTMLPARVPEKLQYVYVDGKQKP